MTLRKPLVHLAVILGIVAGGACPLSAQPEPTHPILNIPGSGSGASSVLSTWPDENVYRMNFVPKQSPRNDSYGFVPAVVSGDAGWSWSSSTPNQITSTPSGTVFPGAPGYPVHTQAVTVLSGNTVQMPYYIRAGSSTAKSLVFNLIDHRKRSQLRSDLNKLAPAYLNSGSTHAARNQAYARRIAVALDYWANHMPDYVMTEKNSASFINVTPSYVLPSDKQRASDHNGLAHEWADDELLAFDAIYDSPALAALSAERGYDVREHIKNDLFCDEGDFIVYHVPIDVAIGSNLSGPYTVLALVARVLNRPDYIEYMDRYLDATVRRKIRRDGTLSEGMGYSIGYINENISGARNTRDYFLSRVADTPELEGVSNRASGYAQALQYGQAQWELMSLPNGQLPSFGDTPFNAYFSARDTGTSALLPAYGALAVGAGSGNEAVQLHQIYSGDNNHMRSDTTAFTLWAFGNEVLGNIRYHNGTPGRQFTEQILACNAVTIDRSDMSSPDADTYGNCDLTLYEPGNEGIAVTEIDGQRAYGNKASRYQRIMLLNTVDLSRPYVVDVFRVTGGKTHDYVLHGSIRYDQTWECSLPLVTNTATCPMLEGGETWSEPTSSGSSFPYYGFWRNVSSNTASGDFQITYRDTSSANRDLRLWMTGGAGLNVNIGNTPVPSRSNGEPDNYWENNLWRPSSIIRKRISSGTLHDLFVSVIEPMNNGVSTIAGVERLPMSGSNLESCALKISFSDGRVDTVMVNLRNPEVAGANTGSTAVSTADGQYVLAGRMGLRTQSPEGSRVWAFNASSFNYPGGTYTPPNLYYSGSIIGETRKLTEGDYDAFITTTPLPLGNALQGKQLSLTHGTLSGSGTTGISEMFEIDHIILTNGQYHICLANDHMLEITNGTTSVEQVAPLRTFTGVNQFEIALSASQPASLPDAPSGLTAIPGDSQVTLNWDEAFGAASYNVKRSTANSGPYDVVASLTTSYFTDAGVTNGMTHYYVVSAVNQIGESPDSTQASATPTDLVPSGLVAHLTFDDGTANDSSGCGNHGSLANGASITTDPQRGKVLSLDGTDDYVDLGNGSSLNLSDNNQATIAAWVKPLVSHSHNTIVSKGEWKEAYSLAIKGDTTPDDRLWTGNDTSVFSGDGVPLGTWTHVAVVINGDLTTFYINGQISGTANQDRGNSIDNTSVGVSIGREQYGGSLPSGRWFFNGELDDVRIYEAALNQTDIQKAMSNVVNNAPVFITEPLNKPGVVAGQNYDGSIASDVTDPDTGDTLTFSKLGGPSWLTVTSNGTLSGMPISADAGTNIFTVRVTDSAGFFDETSLNIAVTPAPPIISTMLWRGDDLLLSWSGGVPPYQVQEKTGILTSVWQSFGETINSNQISISASNTSGFYRIQSQ